MVRVKCKFKETGHVLISKGGRGSLLGSTAQDHSKTALAQSREDFKCRLVYKNIIKL